MPLYKDGYPKIQFEELVKKVNEIENDINFLMLETAGLRSEIMFIKETINNLVKKIVELENSLKKD